MSVIIYLSYLLQGAGLGATAGASPGSFQSYLINQTLVGGWRRGAPIAFAPLISDIPIILTILLLLSRMPANFLRWISLAGGLFALYLAWGLWQQWRSAGPIIITSTESVSSRNSFWRGVIMNLLSPGPYTFWALINGPILVDALRQSWLYAAAFLVGFYGTFIGTMLVLVAVINQARRLGPKSTRTLTLISIIILVIFGLILIYRALF
jgi:threonine/homoserine/homoserine lactone efflux protein